MSDSINNTRRYYNTRSDSMTNGHMQIPTDTYKFEAWLKKKIESSEKELEAASPTKKHEYALCYWAYRFVLEAYQGGAD